MNPTEKILHCEENKGHYKLSIIAQLTNPVKYIIRIEKPNDKPADYVSSLEGFKKIGELLIDLHTFAEEKLYAKDIQQLEELLTPENIKTYLTIKNATKRK